MHYLDAYEIGPSAIRIEVLLYNVVVVVVAFAVVFCEIPQVRFVASRWSIFLPLYSIHGEWFCCVNTQIRYITKH